MLSTNAAVWCYASAKAARVWGSVGVAQATRLIQVLVLPPALCSYGRAMPCPVLTDATVLHIFFCATVLHICYPIITYATFLRICYAMSGTNRGYGPTRRWRGPVCSLTVPPSTPY
eukprot:3611733-Rhodomonas_salina.1